MLRQRALIEGEKQRPTHAAILKQERRLRVEAEPPPGEDAHFLTEQLSIDRLPLDKVPEL